MFKNVKKLKGLGRHLSGKVSLNWIPSTAKNSNPFRGLFFPSVILSSAFQVLLKITCHVNYLHRFLSYLAIDFWRKPNLDRGFLELFSSKCAISILNSTVMFSSKRIVAVSSVERGNSSFLFLTCLLKEKLQNQGCIP